MKRFGRKLTTPTAWQAKQDAAHPARYYGNGGTIHSSSDLDVEVHDGRVVAVWFRCQMLPFAQCDVNKRRAAEMDAAKHDVPQLTGVEVFD